jgi:anti-anti-sigma regulatory factor
MADCRIEDNGKQRVLTLSGELTIQYAELIRSKLLKSMQNIEHLTVRVEGATDVDLTCLQLLCASHRTATQLEVHLDLDREQSEVFKQTAIDTGFFRHTGCTFDTKQECLWLEDVKHE